MKNQVLKISLVCMALVVTLTARAKVVTLVINKDKLTDQISIGTNEVAEIVSSFDNSSYRPDTTGFSYVTVVKDGKTVRINGAHFITTYGVYRGKLAIAGPALIALAYDPGISNEAAFLTLQITPESFPPDKTLIIPADSKGANIIMEQSTDLINWSASLPGAYTNMTSNLFFRIRAERIP